MRFTHQKRHDHGLLRGGDVWIAIGIDGTSGELLEPVGHCQDTTDGTGIISKQHATKGYEETDCDGWPGRTVRARWRLESDRHFELTMSSIRFFVVSMVSD